MNSVIKKLAPVVFILIVVFGCFGSQAQDIQGWDIELDKPFYFIGETMNITVDGPPNTNYSLFLCNITSWQHIHIQTRNLGPLGHSGFDIELGEEWVEPGFFTLNVTVDDYLVAFVEIEIEYDAEYLHKEKHKWLDQFCRWVERTIIDMSINIKDLADDVALFIRVNLLETTVLLIVGGQVLLHVIYPRFHAWAIQKQRNKGYKKSRKGIPAGILQWHDMELEPLLPLHQPNIDKMAAKLANCGVDPVTAKTVVWDTTGDAGRADLVRDSVAKIRRKRAMRKAKKKIASPKNELILANEWFFDRAETQQLKKNKGQIEARERPKFNRLKLIFYAAFLISGFATLLFYNIYLVVAWLATVLIIDITMKRRFNWGIKPTAFVCPDCDFEGGLDMEACPICDIISEEQ